MTTEFIDAEPPPDPDEIVATWERNDMAQAIYAAAAGRVAMGLSSQSMDHDAAFLRTLASYAKFAAAVYFEGGEHDETEAKT